MKAFNNKPYITPCSENLSMDLEGITCASAGGSGDYHEGEGLSVTPPVEFFEDPIVYDDLLQ
jgi:hypothetical protein